ncbi:MAG: cupin domain-containing protein, partial [Candidatus Limnocylindria bacterium]
MTSELQLIRGDALRPDPNPTPGMTRAQAISANGLTSGTVSTAPGVMSGWHHHGTHETSIYVLRGALHMEFAGGAFDARAGDFIHVPAGAVHRESNPGGE